MSLKMICPNGHLGFAPLKPESFHTFVTRLLAAMAKRYARINPVELHDQIRTLEELPSYDDPAA